MSLTAIQNMIPATSKSVCNGVLPFALLLVTGLNQIAFGQTHTLRPTGRTLIEAEDFSAAAPEIIIETSDRCSGKETLAYFWGNTWVEWNVTAPQMLSYNLTLRTSAAKTATQIAVQVIDATGKKKAQSIIAVPKTDGWDDYIDTDPVRLSLPAGQHTLRFRNLTEGANIDFITLSAGGRSDVVTVQPVPNDGPSINPMKGFVSGWKRENADHASVGFQYIEWRKLEPQNDVFDWEAVEEVLDRSGSRGRHLILQFVVDWDDSSKKRPFGNSHYRGPDWLLDLVKENSGPAFPSAAESRVTRATRYDSPLFIDEATEAVAALVEHYRDDPRIYVFQVGVLGYRGEWHTDPRTDWAPSKATKFAILDAYTKSIGANGLTQVRFPNQPVVEPQPALGYTNSTAIMTEQSRQFAAAVTDGELWRNGPIGGEWPQNAELKHWEKFFLSSQGSDFIAQARYSTLFIPDLQQIANWLPGWNQDGLFQKMHRQLGYNFQVTAARHLVSADLSGQIHVEVDLYNAGNAPFYKNWKVQLAVIDARTSVVVELIETPVDIRTLGPGESLTVTGSCMTGLDPRVRYQIGLRIVQPGADKVMTNRWKLEARNTYIELANDVKVIPGSWVKKNSKHMLQGGWNVLDMVERRESIQPQPIKGQFFPFKGSFRPRL